MTADFDQFLVHFNQYITVNELLKQDLLDRVSALFFKKGEIIHPAEKICTRSYFMLKGLARTYYVKDGVEISEYFSAEGEWINSPKSFIQQTKDIYTIDAIEDTFTFALHVKDLVYLFDNYPEMERYARLSMGSVFGHLMNRITIQRFSTAKEKYDNFLSAYQDIHHRIPLGMIASYLGITQSTLSRLRAQK
jgi:CRP-like cAMP-binding protein